MKEKLLYLCKFNPFQTHGGAAIRNRAIIYLLSKKFDVYIVCFSSANVDFCDVENRIYSVRNNTNLVEQFFATKSFSVARFYSRALVELLLRLVKENEFSVIYVSELVMFQYVKFKYCANPNRSKTVLDCHNVESLLMKDAIPYQSGWQKLLFGLEYKALLRFERKAVRESDLVVFVNDADKKSASKLYDCGHKAIVIPNCLVEKPVQNYEEMANDLKLNRFAIVGTLDWHANRNSIRWFIDEIWSKYSHDNHDAQLLLIGKKYKKTEDFVGRGIINHYNVESVGERLESVDICLAPLLYGGGSRLKILEYFFYRKPVIATSKAAQGLVIVPGVHYLKADNSIEFQEAVRNLHDIELRNRLVRNSLELLKNVYDIDLYKNTLLSAL